MDLKDLTTEEVYILLDNISNAYRNEFLEWANANLMIEYGDMYLDGPDGWWIENEQYSFK